MQGHYSNIDHIIISVSTLQPTVHMYYHKAAVKHRRPYNILAGYKPYKTMTTYKVKHDMSPFSAIMFGEKIVDTVDSSFHNCGFPELA